jgi:tetratricopeptide (TPR) repeat protein
MDSGGGRLLVDSAEHVLFHRAPADALTDLRAASTDPSTPDGARALWLSGVALGALGRYGAALELLARPGGPRIQPEAQPRYASLAGSTAASIYRQLGRHADAQRLDTAALRLVDTAALRLVDTAALRLVGTAPPIVDTADAVFDARLGLAADAVGLHRGTDARRLLREAAAVLPDGSWRHRVRLGWVTTEVALLDGDPASAAATARRAVEESEAAQAPRHVAKSLLFLGASLLGELRGTGGRADEAAVALRRAATLATGLGALPLEWVARALLGALLGPTDPDGAATSLRAARAAVAGIAGGLAPADRVAWLARPDLAALGIR